MEFKKITVGNFAENLDRFRIPLSSAEREKKRGKYPYYGAAKIIDYVDGFTHSGLSVLIAEDGSVETDKGYPVVQLANGEYWVNNHTHVLKGKNDWDTLYLYYALQIIKVSPFVTGAVQKKISQKALNSMELNYFEDPMIRRKIVESLLELDKKIELNTQINQTLEQIAQTIFKSWFIDFDPVHAKANALASGQTLEQATQAAMAVISGKNTQELHRLQTANPEQYQQLWEIAETFPSGFDEEGVPRGWEMTVVKSVCEKIQNGGTPKRSNKEYWNNGNIPWLSSGEVCNNNILVSSKEFITQLGLENSSTKLIEANSTLVALYASPTAGKCSFCAFKATTNQAVCALVPKEIYKYFNFYYLQTKEEYYSNQAVGSAQQNISKGIVENTPIFKPDNMILSYFNLIVGGLMNKQISNLKENDHLKSIRDELLPKLLSGEILNGN
ncbi:restriction endonuclease subunit S [Glaesserella parasuis]|nr:restriction endonuclease subunit S [Glaesserella parasuis]MDO9906561.1 restriction endonuclease subunit S [Glaesserella parasuis]